MSATLAVAMPQAGRPTRGLSVRCGAQPPQVMHISSTANQAGGCWREGRRHACIVLPPAPPLPPHRRPASQPLPASVFLSPVKHCVRLRESAKYRGETGNALICGRDLVQELAPLLAPMRALVALDSATLPGVIRGLFETLEQRYDWVTAAKLKHNWGPLVMPPNKLAALPWPFLPLCRHATKPAPLLPLL